MVFDSVCRLRDYAGSVPFLEEVAEELSMRDFSSLPAGEYRTGKSRILIQVQEYDTASDRQFEVHARFIDVHIVLSGTERYEAMRCLDSLPDSFDEADDIGFFSGEMECAVTLTPGVFALSFPSEPHKPRACAAGCSSHVRKIVVKIPV